MNKVASGREDRMGQGRSGKESWKDLLLALAATAVVQATLFLPAPDKPVPSFGDALFDGLLTVPLLWRRRAPHLVLLVIVAAVTTPPALGGLGANPISWLPLAIATFSVGALGSGQRRIAGLVLPPAAVLFRELVLIGAPNPIFLVIDLLLPVGGWFIGDQTRMRRRYLVYLEEKAERTERERREETNRAVVEERARIARELHDLITNRVSSIAEMAGAAQASFENDRANAREVLSSIELRSREALVEIRRLLGLLRSDDSKGLELAPQPTLTRLDALVDGARRSGLEIDVDLVGEPRPLPPGLDLSAYRLIEEAVEKMAGQTSKATIRLTYGPRELEVEVTQSEGGPERVVASNGQSFAGMRERVALFGGDFEARSERAGRLYVRARIPLGER